ncbi:MAG: DNA-binding response OmpR family regulator [Paraglaciecola sp.]|jgi:DNA-binding response OmpR family regulator
MKFLLIQNDQGLLSKLSDFFKKSGHVCESAITFREGYKKINNYDYDCAIIDLDMPSGDNLKLVEMLRKDNEETGIVIISSKNEVADRINGLEVGADDFIGKPFDVLELNARVKAVTRRKTKLFKKELTFGKLSINMDERRVVADETTLKLTKKEFNILLYLARNKNRVVKKESIAEHLWGDHMDEAASFDFIYAHVKNLRKKLVENNCGDFLKTIYGVGYKFESY